METGTLTKTEEAHVDRMAGSFAEPTMSERFKEFASRSIAASDKEKKSKNTAPREINLDEEGRSDEEKKFVKAVAAKEDETKDSKSPAKGAAEKDAAKAAEQKPDAKPSEKPTAKAAEKPAASESDDSPLAANEQYWQRKLERTEDYEKHWQQVGPRIGAMLEFVEKHPEKTHIEAGWTALVNGVKPANQVEFVHDLGTALAEIPNRGEVLRHITLQAQDRQMLSKCGTAKAMRAAIEKISKHYAAAAAPAPKPRAPKPPGALPGRSDAGDDGRETDFGSVSRRMSQRYYGRHAE